MIENYLGMGKYTGVSTFPSTPAELALRPDSNVHLSCHLFRRNGHDEGRNHENCQKSHVSLARRWLESQCSR